ncbi:hypothetical protein AR275_19120 [Stenotrophomonas maltophilia]|nr:hypothetical protein AR275_19120 [Stenotrophomonas maltophilia]
MAIRALRQTREVADYRLAATLSYNEALQQIDRARMVLSKVLQIDAAIGTPTSTSAPAPVDVI